jgi:Protein of unknown function (DUF3592)
MSFELASTAATAAGLGISGAALWLCWMDSRAARWPSVAGVVTRSSLAPTPLEDDGSLDLAYRYRVAGVTYQGGRLAYGKRWQAKARETIERYPVGRPVTVFYDPACPGRAVIEPDGGGSAVGLAALGAAFAFAASFVPWT